MIKKRLRKIRDAEPETGASPTVDNARTMASFVKDSSGYGDHADSTTEQGGHAHRKREAKQISKRTLKKPWHCCVTRLSGVSCPGLAFTTDEMWRHL